MKKVALFHTSSATLAMIQELTAKFLPNVEIMHIIEDSMIKQVMKQGGPTPDINARIAAYVQNAERAGCEAFMTACSSIGHSVEQCQFMVNIPVTRIDEAMANEAISLGPKVTVLATVETTLKPTLAFITKKAEQAGKQITLRSILMSEAFVALLDGDSQTHDRIVAEGLKQALADSDVVVLAQASMARVLNGMQPPAIPVLTSPESGIKWLKSMLDKL
ncbi:MAG: aspartate/glutamate racemase family protein [Limnobaculum xujianqingii]